MISKKNRLFPLILFVLVSANSHAAFVLNSTRYIFNSNKNNISLQVNNESSQEYGGQIWIDNAQDGDDNVYFSPSPVFFKIAEKHKQILRILKINDNLPKDKESLFWINVQEIPKASKDERNSLAIALNTRVKMIYRPEILTEGRDGAEQNIKIINDDKGTILYNDTPYYFAVTRVLKDGHEIKLPELIANKISVFAPFEKISLGMRIPTTGISIVAFDDYGADKEYKLDSLPKKTGK